ncbi:hypothetical protein B0H14DRAFT_3175558 [Mycena olivaceomarginata]|nr:hypothetical protein B0H14DRAFT_3175558 [Mycena olivaceomarginata]
MNAHGRDGTSDGAGHLRLGTVLAVASLLVGAQCEPVSPRSAGKCGAIEDGVEWCSVQGARVLAWCRGAASRRADCGMVAKGSAARKAHVHWGVTRDPIYRFGISTAAEFSRDTSKISMALWKIYLFLPLGRGGGGGGQYGLCRQQSRRSCGAAVWSIAEALPGVAAYKEMYAPHGAARSNFGGIFDIISSSSSVTTLRLLDRI